MKAKKHIAGVSCLCLCSHFWFLTFLESPFGDKWAGFAYEVNLIIDLPFSMCEYTSSFYSSLKETNVISILWKPDGKEIYLGHLLINFFALRLFSKSI